MHGVLQHVRINTSIFHSLAGLERFREMGMARRICGDCAAHMRKWYCRTHRVAGDASLAR